MLHRDVVDQFHDDDGLADAGAAEQSGLAAFDVRGEQVDDLDAGFEHFGVWIQLVERGRFAMDRRSDGAFLDRAPAVDGFAEHVEDAAERRCADWHADGLAGVGDGRAAHDAVGG